ncbi:MAG TPA: DUF6599 family protein [Acidobacteriaceae bacterium]|jgi:hypothetical protein
MGFRSCLASGIVLISATFGACAQTSTAVDLAPSLLPQSFGEWKPAGNPIANPPSPSVSLVNVSKQALEEDKPQRSQVAHYIRDEHGSAVGITVEAIEFDDRTGAYSAYTLVRRPDMREGAELGVNDSVGEGAVLFTQGASLVLVYPATAADIPRLKPLADMLPRPAGNKGAAPLLPTFVPAKALLNGSVRYAVGPATYAAQGGVLPANSIRWNASAEAITADYADKRGKETLTLLLFPTPEIAGTHTHAISAALPSLGSSFANAKVRRDMELVVLANGTFSADDAQKLVDGIHMRQVLSVDHDVQPVFHTEVQKTASLLVNVALLFGILGSAAVLLGLFLGYGRALFRVMRGKPAATEPEFLSLHLDPTNKPAQF